ncbi:MAG: 3-phosphoshikimate 1-carboxyvinyltransferase, partial [Marinilabilia sp.]
METQKIIPPKCPTPATIHLPASKSISNRLLILNALSYSPYPVKNLSDSDDTRVLAKALHSNSNVFDVGAAGTSMRFLTAFLSHIVGEWTITGSERMKERPISVLVDALREIGAKIEYTEKEGYPPLRIFGSALQGKTLELPGDVSSQYISALLMIAPIVSDGLTLKLTGNITSRPYIQLTLKLMEQYGVKSTWRGDEIHVPEQPMKPREMKVEADWSAASYWFQMVALGGENTQMTLQGLDRYSLQ